MNQFFVVADIIVVLLDFWYLDKFEGVDFKYDISFFKFQSKILKKGFFGPNLIYLFLHKTFHFDKFEGTDFKYGYSFSNVQPKVIQIRHFWFQIWKFFVLHKTLLNDIFQNADVKCDNSSSKFKPANNPKVFYPKFNVFLLLHENLFWQIWGCWKKPFSLSKSNPENI